MWTATGLVFSSFVLVVTANTCPQTTADSCGVPLQQGLSSADQAEALRIHNVLRNMVASGAEKRGNPGPQPAASNMRVLSWDTELTSLAQSWADQCTFQHNMCGGSSHGGIGQNLYALMSSSSNTPFNMTAALRSWYDEVSKFSNTWRNPYQFSSATGHYSQVAWAETQKVGCGYIKYLNKNDNLYWSYLVCNYYPAGNVIGASMYNTTGRACSGCPSKTCDQSFTALCTT